MNAQPRVLSLFFPTTKQPSATVITNPAIRKCQELDTFWNKFAPSAYWLARKTTKPSNTRNKPISNELICKLRIENQPQKVFCKDRNLTYVFCSRNYARDLNIQPEEVAGKTDFDFYPKELAEKYRADDERVMQAGKVEELEEKYIENGREEWVHTIKLPVKNENGDIAGIIGMSNDITESYIVKEKLSHLASFPELSPDPVMELDLSGNIQYLNPAAKRLFPELPEKGLKHPYLAGWETLSTFLRDKEGIGFRREIRVNGAWYSQSVEYAPASRTIICSPSPRPSSEPARRAATPSRTTSEPTPPRSRSSWIA